MAVCTSAVLGAHFDFLCDYTPTGAITGAWIGNFADINKATSTLNTNRTIITELNLQASKNIYRLSGMQESYQNTTTFVQRDFDKAYTQSFVYVSPTISEDQLNGLKSLVQGAKTFVIFQTEDIGLDTSLEYRVLGFDTGLELSDITHDSRANAGRIGFTLSNKADQEAKDPFKLYVTKTSDVIDTATSLAALVATG